MIKRYFNFCIGLLMLVGSNTAESNDVISTATSVTSGDVTFHFANSYSVGQFLDGQWWVHNNGEDVVITSITPDSFNDDGRIRNGAEINPLNESTQGFDSLNETGVNTDMIYLASKNVDPGATGEMLTISAGNSVVKAISRVENARRPLINQAAILTVLGSTPADNSFRPAYVGTDKTIVATLDDLNYDVLGKFEPLESTPNISTYVPYMEGVWLDHNTEWTQGDIHPEASMPNYGREISKITSLVGMQLQLNYTDAQKQDALVAMVQYAIDIYGVLQQDPISEKENYYWYNNAANNQGRKLPLLIGGLVLNHEGMLDAVDAKFGDNLLFQEDQQTFYVTEEEIEITAENSSETQVDYTESDLGTADWAVRAWDQPSTLNADWSAKYRTWTGNASVVTALAVMMMDATEEWNWPAFFAYSDRYFSIEGEGVSDALSGNSIHTSAANLWNAYRDQLTTCLCQKPEPIPEPYDPNSVKSGDITFHFAEHYETGQFVDGQWWVHNNGEDVVITSITPDSFNDDGRIRNGAEINPLNEAEQGFDGLRDLDVVNTDMAYDATKNVDPGNTGQALVLSAGNSVIKAISREEDEQRPFITQAAILTILSETPPANSFRPAYVGTDKSIPATLDDLNYNVLGTYPRLDTTPDISEYVPYIEGVWLDHVTEWVQREVHPTSSMPLYGRELGKLTSIVGLQLQLDYTNAEKQAALIATVQYAIDLYGVLGNGPINGKEGYYWYNSGGHNQGRKLPLLIGGLVLNHSGMLAAVNAENGNNLLFSEDQQTFYVSQTEIDRSVADDDEDQVDYTTADIGLAEWGIRYWDGPANYLNADWGSRYRTVTGNVYVVTSLAVRMMNAKEQWGWPAMFDYSDRYFSIQGEAVSDSLFGNSIDTSAAELWNTYRNQLGTNIYEPSVDE
jgi:hypothetical protein